MNELFGIIHRKVSHSKPITEAAVESIQEEINNYMSFYRNKFPCKVIPKMHLLEHHVPQWILAHGVGLGLYSEQGGEGLHSVFNVLKRNHAAIRNGVCQLDSMMKEHLSSVHPVITSSATCIKPRKRKLKDIV